MDRRLENGWTSGTAGAAELSIFLFSTQRTGLHHKSHVALYLVRQQGHRHASMSSPPGQNLIEQNAKGVHTAAATQAAAQGSNAGFIQHGRGHSVTPDAVMSSHCWQMTASLSQAESIPTSHSIGLTRWACPRDHSQTAQGSCEWECPDFCVPHVCAHSKRYRSAHGAHVRPAEMNVCGAATHATHSCSA